MRSHSTAAERGGVLPGAARRDRCHFKGVRCNGFLYNPIDLSIWIWEFKLTAN
jgi:hypothetical protein